MVTQEKSAGVLVFRKEGGVIKFLLLFKKYKTEYWDLVKGGMEKEETPRDTAKREAKEETGLSGLRFLPGFEEKVAWWYKLEGKLVRKRVTYFLAETKTGKITLSKEHLKPGWFTLKEAEKILKHKDTKELLRKAQAFLEKAR